MFEKLNELQKEYDGLTVENVRTIDELVRYVALTGFLVANQTILIYANNEETEMLYDKLCVMNSSLPYCGGVMQNSSSMIIYDSRTAILLSTKRNNYAMRGRMLNIIFVIGEIPDHLSRLLISQKYCGATIIQIKE